MFKTQTFYDPENKLWFGPKEKDYFTGNTSIGESILSSLQNSPDKLIQISANNGFKITKKRMQFLSIRVCQHLQAKGLKQNEFIGIAASNSHYLAPIVFGALLCGTPVSTLDPSFEKNEIKHIYRLTKPKIIFCDPQNYHAMKESVAELNLITTIYLMKGNLKNVDTVEKFLKPTGRESSFVPPKLKEGGDQTALVLCSSGTTGLPKCVCLSHKMLMRQYGLIDRTENDILLYFSTIYWLSGTLRLLMNTLDSCLRIIVDQPFSSELFFKIVEKYHVTHISASPTMLALIVHNLQLDNNYDLSSIKIFSCGGSSVPTVLIQKLNSYLTNGYVTVVYGMTEIGGCVSAESRNCRRIGSAGQILPKCEVKIIDEQNNSLGIGETGEICIKTKEHWIGYCKNESATKHIYDNNGWVHSGDLGYFDSDGFLFIVDRKKDILKYKNFHLYPNEIEEVIQKLSDVVEVSVCGIPDMISTDLPAAVVVKKDGSNLSEEDVFKHVEKELADYKKLRGGVYFVDSLPKTASGKIQRNKIKEIAILLSKNNNTIYNN